MIFLLVCLLIVFVVSFLDTGVYMEDSLVRILYVDSDEVSEEASPKVSKVRTSVAGDEDDEFKLAVDVSDDDVDDMLEQIYNSGGRR